MEGNSISSVLTKCQLKLMLHKQETRAWWRETDDAPLGTKNTRTLCRADPVPAFTLAFSGAVGPQYLCGAVPSQLRCKIT